MCGRRFYKQCGITTLFAVGIPEDSNIEKQYIANLRFLNEHFKTVSLLESQKQICRVVYHRPVSQERKDKQYVTKNELAAKYYSNYCVWQLYSLINDYFIIGILAEKVEAHLVDLKRKIMVCKWEGSEKALVNGDVIFRLSNMTHGLAVMAINWGQLFYTRGENRLSSHDRTLCHLGNILTIFSALVLVMVRDVHVRFFFVFTFRFLMSLLIVLCDMLHKVVKLFKCFSHICKD
uniref:Peptidase_M16 domain-containing protein n=1 Tax=Elaeophora elaphi TaxID=1147741 RepID=A0A0R3S3C1_9BILA